MLPELNNAEKVDYMFGMIYPSSPDSRGPMQFDDEPLPDDPVKEFLAKRIDELSKKSAVRNPDDEPNLYKIIGVEIPSFSMNADPDWNEVIGGVEKRDDELDFSDIYADAKLEAARLKKEWGVEDNEHLLEKRFSGSIRDGKKASRIEKSQNGKWQLEYGSDGQLIRGFLIAEDEAG